MPEWDEKKKKWVDWVGQEQSEADLATAGRDRKYEYAMQNIGRYINKDLAPEVRAPLIAGLQENLQAQYFGKKGLAADRIGEESNLGVAGINARSAENVASITGAAQVDAYRGYGAEGDRIEAESGMAGLRLAQGSGGDDITTVNRSIKTSDEAAPSVATAGEQSAATLTKSYEQLLEEKYRKQKKDRDVVENLFGQEDMGSLGLPGYGRKEYDLDQQRKSIYKRVMNE